MSHITISRREQRFSVGGGHAISINGPERVYLNGHYDIGQGIETEMTVELTDDEVTSLNLVLAAIDQRLRREIVSRLTVAEPVS